MTYSIDTAQVNSATNRPSQGPSASHTVETQILKDRSKGENEMYRYFIPTPVSSSRSPQTSKKLESPVSKPHRCSTEATLITDESAFTLKQRSAQSSHHFQKAQNFCSNSVITAVLESGKDAGVSGGMRTGLTENGVSGGIRSRLDDSLAETQTAYRMSMDSLKKAGLVSQNYPNANNNAEDSTTEVAVYNSIKESFQDQTSTNKAQDDVSFRPGLMTPLAAENDDFVLQHFQTRQSKRGNSDTEIDHDVWKKIQKPNKMSPKNLMELRRHKSETSLRGQHHSQDHYLYRVPENRVKSASHHSTTSMREAGRQDGHHMIGPRDIIMMQDGTTLEGSLVQRSEIDPSFIQSRSIAQSKESSVKNASHVQHKTDGMLKYKPAIGSTEEMKYSTMFLKPFSSRPQTSVTGSSVAGNHLIKGQRKNNTMLSPKNHSGGYQDDSICTDRVTSTPQGTSKFVHVQQLGLQMRGFGIAPSGDQMCSGRIGYHKMREKAEHTGQGHHLSGGRNKEFPCRCRSAKTNQSATLQESKSLAAEVDSKRATEFQDGFQASQKALPIMKHTKMN